MKLHQKICLILIALLPIQTSLHFWPPWSLVLGLRVDYLSPTIYLTDLILFSIIILWCMDIFKSDTSCIKNVILRYSEGSHWYTKFVTNLTTGGILLPRHTRDQNDKQPITKFVIYLFLGLLFIIANIYFSLNPWVNLFKWFKLAQLSLFALYLVKNIKFKQILLPLSFSVIFTSILAAIQFIKQSSIGPIWWLGERPLSVGQPGIAKTIINSELLMRPYATFPHPNAMAGFIIIVLVLVFLSRIKISLWLKLLIGILGTIAILISFSRSAWFVGLLVLAAVVLTSIKPKIKKFHFKIMVICLTIISILAAYLIINLRLANNDSWEQRLFLVQIAYRLFLTQPLVGIGLNNFLVNLPEFWQPGQVFLIQPVHNLFLLILAETGFFGILVIVYFLFKIIRHFVQQIAKKNNNYSLVLLISWLSIILLGLTDHYWLTLQQNLLLLTIVIAFSFKNLSSAK